jgi:hypothetical protein
MLKLLRRSRLVPLLLFLAMPGVGGTLVQAGHHCGDKAPWSASADHASAPQVDHQQHHDDGSNGSGVPGHPCQCVGQCDRSATGPLAPSAPLTLAVAPEATARHHITSDRSAPAVRPDRLLPPAIAPPLG